ncbi:MAG: OmpW family outer membrane protein [Pseudomonadota bacterium]
MRNAILSALMFVMSATGMSANAYEKGDFVLRAGATTVDPNSDSSDINLPGVPTLEAEVDDDTQLGIIPMYMMTEHVGLELLAATPFKHDISLKGQGVDLPAASTKHLPPTLSIQYYPRGGESGWQPYLGVGVNYTIFFDEKTTRQLDETLNMILGANDVDLELDNSFGLSAQAGLDFPLTENFGINLSVWYIDIDTNATVKTDVGNVDFKVDIDPWVYNIGIAYRF